MRLRVRRCHCAVRMACVRMLHRHVLLRWRAWEGVPHRFLLGLHSLRQMLLVQLLLLLRVLRLWVVLQRQLLRCRSMGRGTSRNVQ